MRSSGEGSTPGSSDIYQESFYTFSFTPFMITLFKEDLVRLSELFKASFPIVKFEIGKKSLEYPLDKPDDLDMLSGSKESNRKEFHSLNIRAQSALDPETASYMLLDIDQTTCTICLSHTSSKTQQSIRQSLLGILSRRNSYSFIKNQRMETIFIILDSLLVIYLLFLKDAVDRRFSFTMPDSVLFLTAVFLNIVFLIPHGKNKIYLCYEKTIPFIRKNREIICLILAYSIIGIIILSKLIGV